MKVEIKKLHLVGLAVFIFLVSGYYLFELIFRTLVKESWYGFAVLIVFFASLIVVIDYFIGYNIKTKLAREAAKEVVEKELEANPDMFQRITPETLRSQIEKHLIKKMDEEKYKVWGKKTK